MIVWIAFSTLPVCKFSAFWVILIVLKFDDGLKLAVVGCGEGRQLHVHPFRGGNGKVFIVMLSLLDVIDFTLFSGVRYVDLDTVETFDVDLQMFSIVFT